MLTREEDVEIHALHQRGWSISAIARHTGRNRRTIRNYINGVTTPGVRKPAGEDSFAPFVDYVSARLCEDPHLWARTLCDELEGLGFRLSYPSLTRNIRARGLRPVCQECRSATDRANAVIEHDPGDETQWDWLDLPDPPASWGWGRTAHLLVGSLAHSSKWRASLEPATDQPHLVQGLDRVTRALGGVTKTWRFDRMSTVCDPGSGRITASFAGVAKHYSVAVAVCPPRRGNRKGVVEKVTLPRNAGGAPYPTMSRSNRPKPTWTDSPACAATPGCGPPLRVDPPSLRSPKPNRCNPFQPRRTR